MRIFIFSKLNEAGNTSVGSENGSRTVLKRPAVLMALIVLVLAGLLLVAGTQVAYGQTVYSGTEGTCSWSIDNNGVLTITEGRLNNYSSYYSNAKPSWNVYKSQIKSIRSSGRVECQGMECMFEGYSSLTSIDLSNFDTSGTYNMGGLFSGCQALTSIVFGNFNTPNVSDMSYMFYGCKSLSTIDLSKFSNTNRVKRMNFMFYGCSQLTSLDFSGFGTDYLSEMNSTFERCSSLKDINFNGFKVDAPNGYNAALTKMTSTFKDCSSLKNLDLSDFETSYVTNMNSMFSGCASLEKLDLSWFDTSKVEDMTDIFLNCSSLAELHIGQYWKTVDIESQKKATFPRQMHEKNDETAVYEMGTVVPDGANTYIGENGEGVVPSEDTGGNSNNGNAAGTGNNVNTNTGTTGGTPVDYTPAKAKIKKLVAGKKKAAVKWKKVPNATGYQIRYSLKKNFAGAKTKAVKKYNKKGFVVKGLKKKTKYFVQVRAYRTVDGNTYYGAWSAAKTVKVK